MYHIEEATFLYRERTKKKYIVKTSTNGYSF